MTVKEIRSRVRRRWKSLDRHQRPANLADLLTIPEAAYLARVGVTPKWAWLDRPAIRRRKRLMRDLVAIAIAFPNFFSRLIRRNQ